MAIQNYLEINDAAPIILRFRKKTAATAITVAFTIAAKYTTTAMATCVTPNVVVTTTGNQVAGVVKYLFGI